jgi:hypothetical protein
MSGFKDSTRTVSGHHHWGGGAIGGGGGTGGTINRLARGGPVDKIDENPGHPEVYPKEGNRMQGNSAVQRREAPTEELAEHGGKGSLTSGYKKGGKLKHFHVHKHFHAKGGSHSVSRSYSAEERAAEKFAEGGSVHDCTKVPAQGPDYAKGGHAVHKNAGGAMYAPGGLVAGPAVRPMATMPAPGGARAAPGALGQLAARAPQGMPVRPQMPMRRPMVMPGPQPAMHARGGPVGMEKVARKEVAKHVRTPKPRGHGIK